MRNPNQLAWRSPYTVLTLLLGAALLFLGTNFIVHPHAGAVGYGVQVTSTDADPFLMAKGLRDVGAGIVFFILVIFSTERAVALYMLTVTVIPFGDAAIVAATGGAPAYAVPMHATTAVVMVILSVLMLRRSSTTPAGTIARSAS